MMEIEEEATMLAAKEDWAHAMATEYTISDGYIEFDRALEGARLAVLWIDDYKELCEKSPRTAKEMIDDSYKSAITRATGIGRYLNGDPLLRVLAAAMIIFSWSFGDEAEDVLALI